ncbi:MAG TPA: hypothetical protein VFW07_10910 [Parafilimonas sp.]|nr:hypothetical protein [Parafilimonas sp.]
MKKLLAIILLATHLFNLTGYSLLFQCLMDNADTQVVQRLDNNEYNDKDLVEVKLPLNMPYLTTAKDFVRVDGTLEWNGIQYNYVKRKVAGDTLYLLCLPNFLKTQLHNAKTDLAKAAADIPNSKKSTETSFVKKQGAVNEYNYIAAPFIAFFQLALNRSHNIFICPEILSVFIKSPARPPDHNC